MLKSKCKLNGKISLQLQYDNRSWVSCVVVKRASRCARLVDGGKMMRARGAESCVRVLGDGFEKCGNEFEEVCKG